MKRHTKRHKHSSVIYMDVERLRIRFWNLVIRVDSVNRYFGEIKLFVRKHRLHVTTNGKLLIITEIISPPAYLGDIISNVLVPLGMEPGEDFALIKEESVPKDDNRPTPYIEWELPSTLHLDWLDSFLDYNGCFVQYRAEYEVLQDLLNQTEHN